MHNLSLRSKAALILVGSFLILAALSLAAVQLLEPHTLLLDGTHQTSFLVGFLLILVTLTLITFVLILNHLILTPLARLTATIETMLDGNLAAPFSYLERRDEIGRLANVMNTFRDVVMERRQHAMDLVSAYARLEHERKIQNKLVKELAAARDEAKAADRVKSNFLYIISHELRTPLNAIIGFSEVIKNESLGPNAIQQYTDYAEEIYSSGKHLLCIINDILDLSKIEAEKLDLQEDVFDLIDTTRSVIEILRESAQKSALKLVTNLKEELPLLYADERKVKQILLYLLSNAVKFNIQGGEVHLTITFDPESGFLIEIKDTGIGMSSEDLEKILKPFMQGDDALNRRKEGTGLGLYLTKSLIEMHGGSLAFESAIGKGTTVSIRLPPHRARKAGPAPAPSQAQSRSLPRCTA